jgi:hypothetical protein
MNHQVLNNKKKSNQFWQIWSCFLIQQVDAANLEQKPRRHENMEVYRKHGDAKHDLENS